LAAIIHLVIAERPKEEVVVVEVSG
jgi:hypothetical protein